jgi:hypothetical protein
LAALQRQFITALDASNMADYLNTGKIVITVDLRYLHLDQIAT